MKIKGLSRTASVILLAAISSFASLTPAPLSATVHGMLDDLTSWQYRLPSLTTAVWDTTVGTIYLDGFGVSDVNEYNTSGSAYHVTIAGNVAYVSDHTGGFTSIDITDPYGPDLLNTHLTADAAFGSAVAGNLAFVASWSAGIEIINITNPSYLLHIGTCNTPGYARAVAVGGDYAYVADMGSGLQIIDISNPSSPVIVGSYDSAGDAYDIEIAGNYAYIADNAGGLIVIDISNPTAPSLAGSYPLSTARGIDIAGDVAYVANYFGGLYLIDISDPSSLSLMDLYNTPGICYNVHVAGDYAYVADGSSGGIKVVDVSDPYAISLMYVTYTSTGPLDVRRDGEFLYIADAGGGLAIKRVVSAMPPDETGAAYSAFFVQNPRVHGDYVFAPRLSAGMGVVDVSDPFAPTEEAYYNFTPVYDIVVCGDMAFAAGFEYGLITIDVSDPASPAFVNAYDVAGHDLYGYAWGVDASGRLVCVAAGGDGLIVFDVSDPASPVHLDRADVPGSAENVVIDGDVAWVAAGTGGLRCFDISNPSSIVEVGYYDPVEYVFDVEIHGNYAYLSCGLDGARILDISFPPSPTLVGTASDYSCRGIAIYGDQAFTAGMYDGIILYDLSDPESMDFRTRLAPPSGVPYGIAVNGDFVYAGGYEFGLRALRVYDFYYEGLRNRAGSADYPSAGLEIKKIRLTTSQMGDIDWEYSLDSGASWVPVAENGGDWADVGSIGSAFRWRAEMRLDAYEPDVSPEFSSVRFEWLHETAVIDSVIDVPADQGGYVRVHFSRSSLDFAGEASTPVTAYDIYRRVDDPLLAADVAAGAASGKDDAVRSTAADPASLPGAVTLGEREFVVAGAAAEVPGFPPGVWENVASVHALQTDEYIALVPTEADSAETVPYEVFVITTHTTTPATWFVSPPDSGYSVDDIAPAAPGGFAVAYNTGSGNTLSWDDSPEVDLQYYRVYRSADPDFVPGPASMVWQTASTYWYDPEYDGWDVYYKISAVDFAGNESDAASPATVTGDDTPGLPDAVALRQNVPNPFNPSTTIRFDLPEQMAVRLAVYNVKGESVRTLIDGEQPAGTREVAWDGTSDSGRKVASGIYFYRLTAGREIFTRKMVLLR